KSYGGDLTHRGYARAMKSAWVVSTIAVWAATAAAAPQDKGKAAPAAKKPDAAKKDDKPEIKADAETPDAAPDIPHIEGPKLVDLGNNAEINVPAGMWLIERAEAVRIQEKLGNDTSSLVAMVADPTADWIIVIDYGDVGYVSDGDADELDGAELLESYKEGTVNQNTKRRQLGIPELFVDDWSDRPRYDRSERRLVWGIRAHGSDNEKVINFMTRILGRLGFLSINLIDAPERIDASK